MNRRQFTASLAALVATPALPLAARMPITAAPVVPPGAYAWAELIARSQNTCSPKMLAKLLHLKPEVASVLFKDLVSDGVLRMPGSTGLAKAAQPFDTTGFAHSNAQRLKTKAKEIAKRTFEGDEQADDGPPLVNHDETGLGCDETQPEDRADVSPDQPTKEIPEGG